MNAAPASPAAPLIALADVARTYVTAGGVEVHALRGVSLEIRAGEFVAIQGQSGSGKSTLMNIIGCLDRPTTGAYRISGRDVRSFDADGLAWLRREVFGFVFQSYHLLPTVSAEENVEVPAIYAGMRASARRARARELLAGLGMGERLHHRPSQLSGGQQQRVSIARALMNGGQVILADEPTGALDTESGEDLLELLDGLAARGHTIVVITHDPDVARRADRQIEVRDGRIVRDSGSAPRRAPQIAAANDPGGTTSPPLRAAASIGDVLEAFRMAMQSLRVNLMRTLLTLLGIVIGVFSVITILAIGEGTKERIADEINVLGANRLTVFPNYREFPGARLPLEDASAVLQHIRHVDSVLPETNAEATVRHGNVDYRTRITATAAGFPKIRDWAVATGTFFDDRDSETYTAVAVLGDTARVNLFPYGDDPLGRYILVNRVPFLVIGTMARKGGASGGDEDDVIFVPFKTGASRLFGQPDLRVLTATVVDVERMDTAEADLRALLTKRHGREDFQILNSVQMQESMEEAMSIATLVLGAVGAISLLVGGIGVMNIMLVSVAERTREIGIRMATGARRSDILVQFLSESIVVSVLGGLIGIGFGIAAGSSIALFAPDVWVSFTWVSMAAAFGCAAGIGLVFGYAPARRASRLDPVAALASE